MTELDRLFRTSKLTQIAKPLSKTLRGSQLTPTHQIIATPKSSAIRSNFGLKTALPKQIGFSNIVFNDIDNKQSMPDVEKYSGSFYTRMKFQEMEVPVRSEGKENPLFRNKYSISNSTINNDSVCQALNVETTTSHPKIKKLIDANPNMYRQFKQFMVKNYPERLISSINSNETRLVSEFLNSDSRVVKAKTKLTGPSKKIQGTGGFSYLLKGRVTNTPNGLKYGSIVPGRFVDVRDAAVGGFISNVLDHSTLQRNYTKNFPGKHQRQFVLPFKVSRAEITNEAKVKLEVTGVQTGDWMNNEEVYTSRSNVKGASERMAKDLKQFSALLSVLED